MMLTVMWQDCFPSQILVPPEAKIAQVVKRLDSEYILKIKLIGFADKLNIG